MMTADSALGDACAFWQAGRNGGSSLVRAGARVITGVPHYFCADFIHTYEHAARRDPAALAHACVLLDAVDAAVTLTASEWAQECDVEDQGFAGRGLAPNGEKDLQIEARLDAGVIEMPLWGVTLNRTVTETYGTRFLLEIGEAFPGIAAWTHSRIKSDEQELICGGRYEVRSLDRRAGRTHARLAWLGPVEPRVICDQEAARRPSIG